MAGDAGDGDHLHGLRLGGLPKVGQLHERGRNMHRRPHREIVLEAAEELQKLGVDIEVIDIQSLIPFDLKNDIRKSVEKTNRLLIVDEDVPGGGTAYILNELLEKQSIFPLLDSKPNTLSAKAHRPAYGSDGDYFSKPSLDDVIEAAYEMMHEFDPKQFPKLS